MWIASFLPQLPLDLAFRRWPEALQDNLRSTLPIVIIESGRVGWVSAGAGQAGIVPGMSESGARTRSASVIPVSRDIEAEGRAVTEAALWALHFTPEVAVRHSGLILNVAASLRLFGGVETIAQRLRNGLDELGLTANIAAAPTATAAWWLAQSHDGIIAGDAQYADLVDSLPPTLIEPLMPHAESLKAIGCRTIGQFRRLPRSGIVKRFGKAVLTELDRCFGSEPELFTWYEAPERFCQRIELGARIETTELLLHSARRLLLQMTGFLSARFCAVTQFSLSLHHETVRLGKSPTTRIDIKLGAPSRDLEHLTLLMKEHLAKLVLESSVVEMTLSADALEERAAPNNELFPTATSQSEMLGRLIERLTSRLGPDAVTRIAISADHRPEKCTVHAAPVPVKGARPPSPLSGASFPPRPTWLLKDPIPLITRHNRPFYGAELRLLIGPERIETGWWDDEVIQRDYFVALNESCHLVLWVFRARISIDDEEPGWYLHGFFA
ncbi:Y-family DNA polymerase [Noviherbaspirillum malthae]|uniref:Y-family DNA polymerase n=1 Tax=Noviherbaspirillum malthae TaxID=1260987 RepID=UPI001E5C23DF|nr:DNA polymerase Y family protein [Noviherbaspirillum malthae]